MQIKLVLFCYSVKLPPCSRCLIVRRARSVLNSYIYHNKNFFDFLAVFIFYKQNWTKWCTVLSLLAFLNAELTRSMFRNISNTSPYLFISSLYLLKLLYCISHEDCSIYCEGAFIYCVITEGWGSFSKMLLDDYEEVDRGWPYDGISK